MMFALVELSSGFHGGFHSYRCLEQRLQEVAVPSQHSKKVYIHEVTLATSNDLSLGEV